MAHFKYLMFADRAKRRGLTQISNLFRALALSEYHHARNFYSVLERPAAFMESIGTYVPGESFEYEHLYKMLSAYAKEHQSPLTEQAYESAAAAEKVHANLLKKAADVENFAEDTIYVCPICGYVMTGESVSDRCPVCGGPKKQFEVFEKKAE